MAEASAPEGKSLPRTVVKAGAATLDRLASFRLVYVAIFVFALLYIASVQAAQALLQSHFRSAVEQAVRVSPTDGPVAQQIQRRVAAVVSDSPWVRIGRVRVHAFVLGADERTPLYVIGRSVPPPPVSTLANPYAEAVALLPASATVDVSVPHDSVLATGILVLYGAVLIAVLFSYNRRITRREAALIDSAVADRDATAQRAASIETELEQVRKRLADVEPAEHAQAAEIRSLAQERETLQAKLSELASREAELRGSASRFVELEEERRALEELLEEATQDLGHKEALIQGLQDRLKRAAKAEPAPAAGGKERGWDALERRLRTLYKTIEIDDRAIGDLLALRDETMKLKAEEAIKRLADGSDAAAIRRKVGGLPPQLSIFELGFAGKGRIYYTRGRQRAHRVLAIGAKNTQNADLEYLSRLPD
jgi:DNA repair exonuclease SbcCD ATPase subunit